MIIYVPFRTSYELVLLTHADFAPLFVCRLVFIEVLPLVITLGKCSGHGPVLLPRVEFVFSLKYSRTCS
jgi:hypothetical protein